MAKVPLVTREDIPEDRRHVYDEIAGTRGSVLNLFRTLLNSVDATEAVANLGGYIRYRSPPRPGDTRDGDPGDGAREQHGVRVGAPRAGRPRCGRQGRGDRGHTERQGAHGTAAQGGRVRAGGQGARSRRQAQRRDLSGAVEHLLGPAQTIDLIVLVGYYSMMSKVLLSLDVELDEGASADLPEL